MATVNPAPSTHRIIQVAGSSPASLPNALNSFFRDIQHYHLARSISFLKPTAAELSFNTEEVVRALRRTKENTVNGADNTSGRVLQCCAGQVRGMLQLLFQQSMYCGTVPQLWKRQNDLRPVALTSLVMKAMEISSY